MSAGPALERINGEPIARRDTQLRRKKPSKRMLVECEGDWGGADTKCSQGWSVRLVSLTGMLTGCEDTSVQTKRQKGGRGPSALTTGTEAKKKDAAAE